MSAEENAKISYHKLFLKNFVGGIAWGLGATIGLSIVVAILGLMLNKINLIPIVGEFVSQLIDFVLKNNPNFVK
ncbi:MAG: DUF5665 domain-containing protein [bacterium]|nr:DUF5665 domain-containing protein [bacterium]